VERLNDDKLRQIEAWLQEAAGMDEASLLKTAADAQRELEQEKADGSLAEYVEEMIGQRQAARKEKDFAKADAIRQELLEKGIEIKDTREGTVWNLL